MKAFPNYLDIANQKGASKIKEGKETGPSKFVFKIIDAENYVVHASINGENIHETLTEIIY